MQRREFLSQALSTSSGLLVAPAIIAAAQARPQLPCGVQSGDITNNSAMIWSRSDRAARLMVEYATTESFTNAQKRLGPAALEATDFTARLDLTGLPTGQRIFYRVSFQDLGNSKVFSEPMIGSFRTAPTQARDVSFV